MTVVHSHTRSDLLEYPDVRGGLVSGVLPVRVTADLDLLTATDYRREFTRLVGGPSIQWLLVYLGQDVFVDVSGLDALVASCAAARRRRRGIIAVNPPHCLKRMVEALGLAGTLPMARTPWAAAEQVLGRRRSPTLLRV
jgi:anti-anti-sigma factor